MQRLEVSGAVRPIYGSLGVKRLISSGRSKNHLKLNICVLEQGTAVKICGCSRQRTGDYWQLIRGSGKGMGLRGLSVSLAKILSITTGSRWGR